MADYQYREESVNAAKEIKASSHYSYILAGITLDGAEFASEELVECGQCLVKNDNTGKYEKYADGAAEAATITGGSTMTNADLSGLDAGTTVDIIVGDGTFTISNSDLTGMGGAGTVADIVTLVEGAVDAEGNAVTTEAEVKNDGSDYLVITSLEKGSHTHVKVVINEGAEGDQADVEGVLGVTSGTEDYGVGEFPENYSNPVILDESIKFKLDNDGNNADQVAGQVLVHGAVHESMLNNCTDAFKKALAGNIRFV